MKKSVLLSKIFKVQEKNVKSLSNFDSKAKIRPVSHNKLKLSLNKSIFKAGKHMLLGGLAKNERNKALHFLQLRNKLE